MRCELADSLLHSYFDGELSDLCADEYEFHLQHCVDCSVALVEQELLCHRLQLAQLSEPAPAALRHKIRADLRSLSCARAGSPPLLGQWLAAAAALLLVALAVLRVTPDLRSNDYQAELAGEIVDMHRHSLQPGHMTTIASNNEEVVRQWFDDRLNFALPVRNFAGEDFTLQGGRLDDVEGRSVAAIVYLGNGHLINVFMWPTKNQNRSPQVGSLGTYQWLYWRKARVEFCIVSDAPLGDLEHLYRLIAAD